MDTTASRGVQAGPTLVSAQPLAVTPMRKPYLAPALLLFLLAACFASPRAEALDSIASKPACASEVEIATPAETPPPAAPEEAKPVRSAQAKRRSRPAQPGATTQRDSGTSTPTALSSRGSDVPVAEPRADYYWNDCLMTGFAVLPHCGY